jgi:geranylgeranyl diphosphate synthase, type II
MSETSESARVILGPGGARVHATASSQSTGHSSTARPKGRGDDTRIGLDAGWLPPQDADMRARVPLSAERDARSDPRVLKTAIDYRLAKLLPDVPGSGDLGAALRYSLLAPGKRIRPLLTILAAWESGHDDLMALDAGCALEMVHAASLILDDLPAMDDAPERRGQASTHVRFGEDVAMLSAITLLNQAYATIAGMEGVDAATRCALIAILSRAVGLQGLAGGQYADLRPGERREATGISRTTHLKTGVLFVAAVDMAAAVHRIRADVALQLRTCATELGQAFQLLDDLIDSRAFAMPGRREDDGKATLLALLGQDAVHRRLRGHMDAALAGLQATGPLASFIRSIFAIVELAPA